MRLYLPLLPCSKSIRTERERRWDLAEVGRGKILEEAEEGKRGFSCDESVNNVVTAFPRHLCRRIRSKLRSRRLILKRYGDLFKFNVNKAVILLFITSSHIKVTL